MNATTLAAPRIGILGGAFDPPHLAHLALAQAAVEQLQLDQLIVLPTGQAWHKARALSDSAHRLAMAQLAFADLAQAHIDARETRRLGPSYTIDTLRQLCGEVQPAQWFLIIGADQAQALTQWQGWQEIIQLATICVADRPDLTACNAASEAEKAYPERFFHLRMPLSAVSATAIRLAVARQQSIAGLVSDPVARYIADHHLYIENQAV